MTALKEWATPLDSPVTKLVATVSEQCLGAYREQPRRVEEDYRREFATAYGAYRDRQLFELVQNAADALSEVGMRGRVEVTLTEHALYCSNEGAPIDLDGVEALLHSHISRKNQNQIGHFGLGFKAILAVTSNPRFYSRSGSFAFDADWSRRRIKVVVPGASETPTLRMATPIDPSRDAEADSELAEAMKWAASVVKLPCAPEKIARLAKNMDEFPSEFMLFAKSVEQLRLTNRVTGDVRVLRARDLDNDIVEITDGEEHSTWKMFTEDFVPVSPEAREVANRDSIPMVWAVPSEDLASRGRFWAFFPTKDETTMRGILNAGWSTSSDRYSLLDDELSRELLGAFASFVSESVSDLYNREKPGAHIDVLPARDTVNWADKQLSGQLMEKLRDRRIIPDLKGELHLANELQLHPTESTEAQQYFSQIEPHPDGWVHADLMKRERRFKATQLGADASGDLKEWLESMVQNPSVANARLAVLAAASCWESDLLHQWKIERARIILTKEGDLVSAGERVFWTEHDREAREDVHIVDPGLSRDAAVLRALETLGVRPLSDETRLDVLLESKFPDWSRVWALVHALSEDASTERISKLASDGRLFVRGRSGGFKYFMGVLFAGSIVPGDVGEDLDNCLDEEFHDRELSCLRKIGIVSEPMLGGAKEDEPILEQYRKEARSRFRENAEKCDLSRPQLDYISFKTAPVSGPLTPLLNLTPPACARYVEALLPLARMDESWETYHYSRGDYYPRVPSDPPAVWAILEHGKLRTSQGIVSVEDAVGQELARWGLFLPVWSDAGTSMPVRPLPSILDDLETRHWDGAFARTLESESLDSVADLYLAAAEIGVSPPALIRCRSRGQLVRKPPSEVFTVPDGSVFDTSDGTAVLPVPNTDSAKQLAERWGLQLDNGTDPPAFGYEPVGPGEPASERFPILTTLAGEEADRIELIPCSQIWVESRGEHGLQRSSREYCRDGSRFYFDDAISEEQLLDVVARNLGIVIPLTTTVKKRNTVRLAAVNRCESIEEKLILLAGADGLRRCIPAQILESPEIQSDGSSPSDYAKIALAIHGTSVLRHLQPELESSDLCPPRRWAGSEAALSLVRQLGLPDEFAGTRASEVAPWMDVDGPVVLKGLHDFQKVVKERIQGLLLDSSPRRGLLTLPTGAGKTRVVVEAIVDLLRSSKLRAPILWIANRDELCEQAVQAWKEIWQARGSASSLRISRLWGSPNRRIDDVGLRQHVVVATYQTLSRRLRDEFEWLKNCACVVIDEAHGSTTSSFTEILDWLGIDSRRTDRHLIGLTATPYRGSESDAKETKRLVNRYHAHRFDDELFDGDDPYMHLQREGILAHVEHRLLPGVDFELEPHELDHLRQFAELPSSAEERLGKHLNRNRTIIDEVAALPPDWPQLLFAASVDHAELLASLLSVRGIPAAAISNKSERLARRDAIDRFKQGGIRVLTNYGVLTTGFDAPGVRAIVVARPVFSPGLYQQMIGRGLRGPENGGKERCLIINVADNVKEYGENLAFSHFEHLWRS